MPGSNGIRSRRSSESVSLERCSSSVLKPQRSGKNDIPARRSSPKLRKRSYSRSSGGCRGRAGSDNSRSNSGHRRGSSVSSGSDSQNEKTHIRQSVSESRSPSRTKLPPHTTVPSSNTSRRSAVVTNLTRSVTGDHLREIFGLFGTIMDVQLMRDPIVSGGVEGLTTSKWLLASFWPVKPHTSCMPARRNNQKALFQLCWSTHGRFFSRSRLGWEQWLLLRIQKMCRQQLSTWTGLVFLLCQYSGCLSLQTLHLCCRAKLMGILSEWRY